MLSNFISVSISSIYCQTGYNKILSQELKPNERYFPAVAGNDNYFAIAVSTMAEDGLNIIKQSVYVYEKLNNEWKFSQILIPASGSSLVWTFNDILG
ncbi:MAG: hypothetical protein IPL55_00325 [Saprospiraceae bacterium]|nr:hypothetical protein [Saprospiraceae bacterium]